MIEINLVPDVKQEFIRAKMMRNFVISISVIVGVVVIGLAVVLGVVLGGQLVTESWQDGQIKKENDTLMAVEDLNKTVTIQKQLKTIDTQQNNKLVTSRLFDAVLAINPPAPNQIRLTALKLDPAGKRITIEGSAVNGFLALETFKKTLINTTVQVGTEGELTPLAQDIITGETGFGENAEGQRVLRFSFSFAYPDALFQISNDPVLVVTPTGRIDVTDSRLGIPDSLFDSSVERSEDAQ